LLQIWSVEKKEQFI